MELIFEIFLMADAISSDGIEIWNCSKTTKYVTWNADENKSDFQMMRINLLTIVASNCLRKRRKSFILKNHNHFTISFLVPYRFKEISINGEKSSQV